MKIFRKLLKKKGKVYFNDVENVVRILPFLMNAAKIIWKESTNKKGIKRWDYFISELVVFSLTYTLDDTEILNTLG